MSAPAFQFYPSDFLSDKNTMVMSATEIGAYTLLMCVCWREGSLPNDVEELAAIARMDIEGFRESWNRRIERCFRQNGAGEWVHPRLEKEREKQSTYQEEQSKRGKLGAKRRWQQAKNGENDGENGGAIPAPSSENGGAIDPPMANHSSSSSSSSSDIREVPKGTSLVRDSDSEPTWNSQDMQNAMLLRDQIIVADPKYYSKARKKPDLDKWADEFRLMRTADKRSQEDVNKVLQGFVHHDFWCRNIRSPGALRGDMRSGGDKFLKILNDIQRLEQQHEATRKHRNGTAKTVPCQFKRPILELERDERPDALRKIGLDPAHYDLDTLEPAH